MEPAIQRTPPEIWYYIFEQATFTAHAFDTGATDPFDIPGASYFFDRVGQEELRASLATKRALVLVCRRWHALATPLLYEAVSAGDNRTLQCLCDTLAHCTHDHQHMGRTAPGLPSRIQIRVHRFDLLNWFRSDLDPSSATRVFPMPDILARLIFHMPDLEIFCELVGMPLYDDPEGGVYPYLRPALDALRVCCAMSLRKCVLGSFCTVPADVCISMLTGFPRLSSLFSSYTTNPGTATSESATDTDTDPATLTRNHPPRSLTPPPPLTSRTIQFRNLVDTPISGPGRSPLSSTSTSASRATTTPHPHPPQRSSTPKAPTSNPSTSTSVARTHAPRPPLMRACSRHTARASRTSCWSCTHGACCASRRASRTWAYSR
ncbi:hypothetical protein DENSPDRAFT_844890 [Dentipellis sp. KUC8613]|nr:hypothetical protein DENSPDRAFT_844890 [Dentipellis sp. KUC8613]